MALASGFVAALARMREPGIELGHLRAHGFGRGLEFRGGGPELRLDGAHDAALRARFSSSSYALSVAAPKQAKMTVAGNAFAAR
ncbi:hypothetical protein D3C83_103540 [compost metagenome]